MLTWRRYLRSPGVARIVRAVTFLRGSAMLLLVLALAGAQWMMLNRGVDLLFLVDVSESVTSPQRSLGLDFVRHTAHQIGRSDRAGLIAFSGEALIDQPLGSNLTQLRQIESTPTRSETDLQSALELALSYGDVQRNLRVVVISDGLSTRGDPEFLLPSFKDRGVPIDAFLVGAPPESEVSIEQVAAPAHVQENQPFGVRVVVGATQTTTGRLWLFRNGSLVSERSVQLEAGRNVFDFANLKESAGLTRFEVRLEAAKDTLQQNNAGYVTVTVDGPSKVLIITDSPTGSAALISALRRNSIPTEVISPAMLPANATALAAFSAILIHDVPALSFSRTQLEQIASYVRELGGGLVNIGGHNSYGLGGYYKTPLESVLPVAIDVSQTVVMPSLALVLILDKSGSMASLQGRRDKITLAKEAALGVLDVMLDHDLFGVLAFDSEPYWVVPLQLTSDRLGMAHQIGAIGAGGGTDLGPAMLEAYKALSAAEAVVKHAIILSDGQSMEYDFPAVTALLHSTGATVSTVAIGEDADRHLLATIARMGDGRFYYTDDADTIPQIFATEAFVVSRPLAVEERVQPKTRQPAAFLAGIQMDRLPSLSGYVLTSPKATSAIHLESEDANPILASWRHGLGRVVAFTSGATTTWAADWLRWRDFGAFWSQTVRWAMRPEQPSQLRTHFDIHESQATIVVDAIDAQGRFLNFLQLQAEVLSPSGDSQRLTLEQTAPGQYQTQFSTGEEGAWLAAVADPNRPDFDKPFVVGTVLPYSNEYRLIGQDSSSLERLVMATGGTLFASETMPSGSELKALLRHPHPVRHPVSLWPVLLFVAFLLFLLDITIRYLPPATLRQLELALWGSTSVIATSTGVEQIEETAEEVPAGITLEIAPPPRLEDLIQRRRQADLSSQPLLQPGRYLARLRRTRRHDKPRDEGQ
jgi:Ca-activated chloride channel family protein